MQWWAAIKLARSQTRRTVSGFLDKAGREFHYTMPDPLLELLRFAKIGLPEHVTWGNRIAKLPASLLQDAHRLHLPPLYYPHIIGTTWVP